MNETAMLDVAGSTTAATALFFPRAMATLSSLRHVSFSSFAAGRLHIVDCGNTLLTHTNRRA
jgi:hypothetical protein